jgi:hypothetical protein
MNSSPGRCTCGFKAGYDENQIPAFQDDSFERSKGGK